MTEGGNPFCTLFSSEEELSVRKTSASKRRQRVCDLLTRIFLFTASDYLDGEKAFLRCLPQFVVRLPQLTKDELVNGRSGELTLDNYPIALAERILLSSSDFDLIHLNSGVDKGRFIEKHNCIEPNAFKYLTECYSRAEHESKAEIIKKSKDDEQFGYNFRELKMIIIKHCQREIISTASIVLHTGHARKKLSSHKMDGFVSLLTHALTPGSPIPLQFFYDIAQSLSNDFETLKIIFEEVLQGLYSSVSVAKLSTVDLDHNLNVLEFFSSHPALSKVLVNFKHWFPDVDSSGQAFETQTILGKFLSPSSIAETPVSPSSYFPVDLLYQSEVDQTTISLQYQLDHITTRLHKIFDALFRACPESRRALTTWLVRCMESNKERGKMVSRFNRVLGQTTHSSDGFFLNLSWIMLRLCTPFLTLKHIDSKRSSRVANIDVTYCAALSKDKAQSIDGGGPLIDFSGEAMLVPSSDEMMQDLQAISPNVPFNFVTHCFFITHKCLMLGITQVIYKYQDINQRLSQLHGLVDGMDGIEPPPGSQLSIALVQFRIFSSQLFGIKAHALNPKLMDMCLSFYSTTAQWMVQLVVSNGDSTIPNEPLPPVRMIPECLVENMSNIVMVLRQMSSQLTISSHQIHQFLSFSTIFMRSSSFINNPHIRAKLAQLIQFIINSDENSSSSFDVDFLKEVFSSNPLATKQFLPAVLSIFIDIERTGDPMEFEDKFVYRLPIYEILEFLWKLPDYRPSIDVLVEEVSSEVQNIPLFMRFMNMIINDAIVQLDEGLESLATIKEIEGLKYSEEWNALTDERKKEYEEKLKEAKMYASNRNQMANKTVYALNFITKDTRKPFIIPGIVDRMAAMLNYVLKQLVGKGNVNFKVKDSEKYHFYPRDLVKNVIAIYINLGQEKLFREALPQDRRSFTIHLFPQAERVIRLICEDQHSILEEWKKLHLEVKECCGKLSIEDEAFENAPEEFLDPITNNLMIDPVTLPTSGIITDRSTITRHLLSVQQDPFSRAPLTADMLQSNRELQSRIMTWKLERMKNVD